MLHDSAILFPAGFFAGKLSLLSSLREERTCFRVFVCKPAATELIGPASMCFTFNIARKIHDARAGLSFGNVAEKVDGGQCRVNK